ncbi:hypothetical protein Rhe02_18740 [Rhizocola hellebori]|uniref:Uncharacterized protein n=1 Tax=Rhizocola hellebori TaxID=1392758 RepID=A0A8J3VF55_9ACTN|nr:hypothetical protein [Rhizocola hellebori]GIH03807.1 hypothetical protein Rhe02_18740 [Rhizocola hellebori]
MKTRTLSRAAAMGLAALATTATLAAGTPAAQAAPAPLACGFIHSLTLAAGPSRVVVEGELTCGGRLFVKLFRNDVQVISGGNGVGVVTFTRNCQTSALSHWKAVWSNGTVDEADFACF